MEKARLGSEHYSCLMKILDSVDVRKGICSRPLLDVRIRMNMIKPRDIMEVFADKDSHKDIVKVFEKTLKQEVVELRIKEGYVRILLRKTQ